MPPTLRRWGALRDPWFLRDGSRRWETAVMRDEWGGVEAAGGGGDGGGVVPARPWPGRCCRAVWQHGGGLGGRKMPEAKWKIAQRALRRGSEPYGM